MKEPANFYRIGKHDAEHNAYPLWAVLVCAELYDAARSYATGWYEITGYDLCKWYDASSDGDR